MSNQKLPPPPRKVPVMRATKTGRIQASKPGSPPVELGQVVKVEVSSKPPETPKKVKNADMDAAVKAYRESKGIEHTEERADAFSHSAIDTGFTCTHKYELNYVRRLKVPRNLNLITGSAIDDCVSWALTPKLTGLPLPAVSAIVDRFKLEYYWTLLNGFNISPAKPEEGENRAAFQQDVPEELLKRLDHAQQDPAIIKGLAEARSGLFIDLWKGFNDRFTGVKLDPEDDDPIENARILEIALQDLADNHLPAVEPKFLQKTMLMDVAGSPKPFWFIPDIVTVGDDDGFGVIDVKTSKNKKPDDWADKSSQLEEYQAGLELEGHKVGTLGYLILVKSKKKPWVQVQRVKARTKEQIEKSLKVLAMKARILHGLKEFPPCAPDALANPCSWCDYLGAGCEYREKPPARVTEHVIDDSVEAKPAGKRKKSTNDEAVID